jgi:hypothetical protein
MDMLMATSRLSFPEGPHGHISGYLVPSLLQMRRHREHIRSLVVFHAESAHEHERNLQQRSREVTALTPARHPRSHRHRVESCVVRCGSRPFRTPSLLVVLGELVQTTPEVDHSPAGPLPNRAHRPGSSPRRASSLLRPWRRPRAGPAGNATPRCTGRPKPTATHSRDQL